MVVIRSARVVGFCHLFFSKFNSGQSSMLCKFIRTEHFEGSEVVRGPEVQKTSPFLVCGTFVVQQFVDHIDGKFVFVIGQTSAVVMRVMRPLFLIGIRSVRLHQVSLNTSELRRHISHRVVVAVGQIEGSIHIADR